MTDFLQDAIIAQAKALGFSAVAFAPAGLPRETAEDLSGFLALGHHGDMGWMEERAQLRASPAALWPEAKSAIVVGHNYAPDHNPMENLADPHLGNISVYARNKDYHDVIKKKLKALARHIAETHGCEVKVFVDTAPLMEKPLAAQAGLGWQGKHTCLVSREFGSWLFLGVILTTLPLSSCGERSESAGSPSAHAQDNAKEDHCGSCTRCLDICPTQAFTAARRIDARRCISYLTIEHKGHIPEEFLDAIGNRIYGCDDCLSVCPWNKFAQSAQEAAYHAREQLKAPPLAMLAALDDAAFRAFFSGSPVKRIGRNRFIRNVLVAIGNTQAARYRSVIIPLLTDSSALVRAMAVRALRRCAPDDFAGQRSRMAAAESDADVARQWNLPLRAVLRNSGSAL